MKTVASSVLFFAASAGAFTANNHGPRLSTTAVHETQADLKVLAKNLNPVVKFYDPLHLSELEFWEQSEEASIGFLRHAEIKHGRVAMAAFVGYCIQSNLVFSWPQTTAGDLPPSVDLLPEQQWDAIPLWAKYQIVAVVGFLEFWDEVGGMELDHYMRGRQPGKYPTFDYFRKEVHWVPDLYDPAGTNKKMTQEKKDTRLLAEINNGRLAMIGIFGFLVADKIPGSVPLLESIAKPYDGEPMIPW
eukprot:CAMPEP_0201148132 /NCGR_PEP_ID=MMETSP0851-20130426/9616_1 /ASSEMBLY_ACC=CAM_ASM_000631 /TAXON_ID=183588 /ORGANISM="Pseudo-nitzschia fraudulenta, Strain WWA7" /LENGTH=244 /DNA_ID=CAMNT_0047424189 /DNA_START=83 /DNA_END=817 /DNA_ORIENTATION=+